MPITFLFDLLAHFLRLPLKDIDHRLLLRPVGGLSDKCGRIGAVLKKIVCPKLAGFGGGFDLISLIPWIWRPLGRTLGVLSTFTA